MKTLFSIIGGIVALAGLGWAGYTFLWLPRIRKVSMEVIDYLNKTVTYKTNVFSGQVSVAELKQKGNYGINKGNDSLEFKLIGENQIQFSLQHNDATVQTITVDFDKRLTF